VDRLDRLDAATDGRRSTSRFALDGLLNIVGWGLNHEPARSLIARHAHDLAHLTPRLAIFALELVTRRVRGGQRLPLGVQQGYQWAVAAMALDAIELANEGLAEVVYAQNSDAIAAGLSTVQRGATRAAATLLEGDAAHKPCPDVSNGSLP
jgi:hypothetical protein